MASKRLVVCMDGTWQNMATSKQITNVAKIALSVKPASSDGVQQLVFYSPGIGGEAFLGDTDNRFFKGAIGEGAEEAIVSAYLFLSLNYQVGDEIYLFGFSRGAFCVRSLGGLISACGLIQRENAQNVREGFDLYRAHSEDKAQRDRILADRATFRGKNCIVASPKAEREEDKTRPQIKYIGVFDTVVMRGVPNTNKKNASTTSKKYGFHDLELGNHVASARHALAIDERRNALRPTPWTNLTERNEELRCDPLHPEAPFQQKWFTGAHGDVGGGMSEELSEVSRKWIKRGAVLQGLQFGGEPLGIEPEPDKSYKFLEGAIEELKGFLNILGLEDRVAYPELTEAIAGETQNWGDQLARAAKNMVTRKPQPTPAEIERLVHVSAYIRAQQKPKKKKDLYAPTTIKPLLEGLNKLQGGQTDRDKLISKLCDQMRYSHAQPQAVGQTMFVDKLPGQNTPVA